MELSQIMGTAGNCWKHAQSRVQPIQAPAIATLSACMAQLSWCVLAIVWALSALPRISATLGRPVR